MQADLGSPFGETPCSGNSAGVNYTNLPLHAQESSTFFNHGLPAPSPKPLPPQRQVSNDFNDITNNYDRASNMHMLIGNMSRMSSDESLSVLTSAENSRQGYNSLCNTPRESSDHGVVGNFSFLAAAPRCRMTLQQMKDRWSGLYASCDAESMSSLDFDYFVDGLVEIRKADPSFMRCVCCVTANRVTANQVKAGTHECTECREVNTRKLKSKKVIEASRILKPNVHATVVNRFSPQLHIDKEVYGFVEQGNCKKCCVALVNWTRYLQIAGGCVFTPNTTKTTTTTTTKRNKQSQKELILLSKKSLVCLGQPSSFYVKWSGRLVSSFTDKLGGDAVMVKATKLFFDQALMDELPKMLDACYMKEPTVGYQGGLDDACIDSSSKGVPQRMFDNVEFATGRGSGTTTVKEEGGSTMFNMKSNATMPTADEYFPQFSAEGTCMTMGGSTVSTTSTTSTSAASAVALQEEQANAISLYVDAWNCTDKGQDYPIDCHFLNQMMTSMTVNTQQWCRTLHMNHILSDTTISQDECADVCKYLLSFALEERPCSMNETSTGMSPKKKKLRSNSTTSLKRSRDGSSMEEYSSMDED